MESTNARNANEGRFLALLGFLTFLAFLGFLESERWRALALPARLALLAVRHENPPPRR